MASTNHHQHYALDENGNRVFIDDVVNGGKYYCLFCHGEMIAKRGAKREHHFAHKHQEQECSWESYLHALAKTKIADWLKGSSKIDLYLPTLCEKAESCPLFTGCQGDDKSFNILDYYQLEGVETGFGGFIPDILLLPKGKNTDPIFIEICVSHPCTQEKIDSGYRIIEVSFTEEAEIDEFILCGKIDYRSLKLYNFKQQYTHGVSCVVGRFTLHRSGKPYVDTVDCSQIESDNKGLCQIYVPIYDLDFPGLYQWCMVTALEHGVLFKNCSICRFCVYNEYYGTFICKLYKKYNLGISCRDNDASRCSYYQQEVVDLYKNSPIITKREQYIFKDNTKK